MVKQSDSKVSEANRPASKWPLERLFWGLLLIVIGGLILADNFGYAEVNWTDVWRLWPFAVIAAGLSIIASRTLLWRLVTIVFIILTLGAVIFVALNEYVDPATAARTSEATVSRIADDIERAEVTIKAGASMLVVDTAPQSEIVDATLESNVSRLSQKSVRDGSTQRITLAMQGSSGWWIGDVRSAWDVQLTRRLPLDINIDTGASNANIDFSQAQLRTLDIDAGASKLVLTLGDRETSASVNLDAGASSIIIRVPKDSGIRVTLDRGLVSTQLGDLQEVDDNTFESSGYADADNKIQITGKIGASSFTIERY